MRLAPGPDLLARAQEPGDPAVSVILNTYQRPHVVARAARSVLAQTFSDLELIVIDDEPSAEAEAVVAALGDGRVHYIAHDRNLRLPAARNTGLRASRGPLVAFIDDDDEWAPEKLAGQIALLEQMGPDVGVVTCFQRFVRDDGTTTRIRAIPTEGDVLPALLQNDIVNAQVLLVRRLVLEDVGLFLEELPFYEDYELSLRLAAATRWATWPEPGVTMHRSVESMSGSGLDRRIISWQMLIDRHGAAVGPRTVSRWWTKVARLRADQGDRAGWRQAMAQAIRAHPPSWAAWGRALMGPGGHTRLARRRGQRRAAVGAAR